MEKYIVGVVLMDKNGKIYRWCYFDVKILTSFCIDFVLMIQNVKEKKLYWCWGMAMGPYRYTVVDMIKDMYI